MVIPPGQNILLDVSPPRLNLILVSGRLTVEDARDVTIDASYIFVRGVGSSFTVGTEAAPFTHKAVITLHGIPKVGPRWATSSTRTRFEPRRDSRVKWHPMTWRATLPRQALAQGDA